MFDFKLLQSRRSIMHVDADAFFATVEQILNPSLRGKAVLVAGPSTENGIVCAASYEARKFDIHAGMPLYQAKQRCKNAVVVCGNFDAYRSFSKRMYEIFLNFTPDVEMASIDEAYMDITGCEKLHKMTREEIARSILMEIHNKLGLSVSCGLASSKMIAKVCSSTNKPHKLTSVAYGKEKAFLAPLELKSMPGIGPKTFALLQSYGFSKIGDISELSQGQAYEKFGVQGLALWKRCKGVDNSLVIAQAQLPKSISKEHTFYNSDQEMENCHRSLRDLSEIVFLKLRAYQLKAKTVFVKIRYKNEAGEKYSFEDYTFQENLDLPSCSDKKLFEVAKRILSENLQKSRQVRLLGVGVSKLIKSYNLSLFENDNDEEKLFFQIDKIKKMYGSEAISYGN